MTQTMLLFSAPRCCARLALGNNRSRVRLGALVLIAVLAGLAARADLARAGTWNINGTIANTSTMQLSIGAQPPTLVDGTWGTQPGAVAPGASSPFSFTAPIHDTGADMYADYQLANGNEYEIITEDDEHTGGGVEPAGNYVGCAEPVAQGHPGAASVCAAQWGGTYENMAPTYYSGPNPPIAAVGQTCQSTFSWPTVYDCSQGGLIAPTDASNPMSLTFQNTGTQPTYVQDSSNNTNCRMQTPGSQCTIATSGSAGDQILLGAVNTQQNQSYQFSVELVAESDGPYNVGQQGIAIWPWGGTSGGSTNPGGASGWKIYPKIFNRTGASGGSTCGANASSEAGCLTLTGAGVTDGDWTGADGAGGTYLPATCGGGAPSGCSNASFPYFDAPHFDEGADGAWNYTAPDGNTFGLAGDDNENGLGVRAAAATGCTAAKTSTNQYFCFTRFSTGGAAGGSVNPFQLDFDFYPVSAWASNQIGAGEVCTVPAGATNFTCAAGALCPFNEGSGTWSPCSPSGPGAGWGPTDPQQYMALSFVDLSSSGAVTVTDEPLVNSCQLTTGTTCSFVTSGGTAAQFPGPPVNGASDALQVTNPGGTAAQVEVYEEGEASAGFMSGADQDILNQMLATWSYCYYDNGGGCFGGGDGGGGEAVGGKRALALRLLRARFTRLRVPGAHRPNAVVPSSLSVTYRQRMRAASVLTFARAFPGVRAGGRCVAARRASGRRHRACTRWVSLPGAHPLASWTAVWHKTRKRPCPAHRHGRAGQCSVRIILSGHVRHDDTVGLNHLWFRDRPLAPGRYRVTVISIAHRRVSQAARTTFVVKAPARSR
jgi:hypothetical protein